MADLKEQRYILEIAKVQGIARAAENLYISQPALSKFLLRTEDAYGIRLFDRIGKKLVPTYAGEQYLAYAKQMVQLDDSFRAQIEDIKTYKTGSLAIGSTIGRGKNIFPKILPAFYRKYPGFDLQVFQENASVLDNMLRDNQIQVAMLTEVEGEDRSADFHVEEISTEEICLIVPKSRNIHGVPKYGFRYPWVDIRQIREEVFLLLNEGTRLRVVADKIIRDYGISLKTMEFYSIDTIWKLVSQGFGIALASDFEAPDDPNVELFSIGSRPVRWKFIAMTKIGSHVSVPVQTIIEIAREFYENH